MTVSGRLALPEGAAARGEATMVAEAGALDLAPAVLAGADVSLRFSAAQGYRVVETREYSGLPSYGVTLGDPERANRSIRLGEGTLSGFACGGNCSVLVFADAGAGASLSLSGHAAGSLRPLGEPVVYAVGGTERPRPDAFLYRAEPGWVAASSRHPPGLPALVLGEASALASGPLGIHLYNVSAEWRGASGAQRIDTLRTMEPVEGPAGIERGWRVHIPFLVLHVEQGALAIPPGADVLLLAPAPALQVAGRVEAERASGHLVLDGRRVDLQGDAVEVQGDLVLSLAGRLRDAPVPALGVPLDAAFDGEASRVVVAGRPVAFPSTTATTTAAIVTGASLVGILAALLCLKMAGLPFYMRVARGSLLRNENRRRILETVRARPGVTVPELVRELGLSEMAVRHHVRMLEAHRHLAVRGSAKVRGLFALDGATDPAEMASRVVLKDPTRRRIAALLAASEGPLTQAGLSEGAGVSRRLVSYHLARLEEAGLVEPSGAGPAGYRATARLGAVLAEAPGAASLPPPASA